MQITNVMLHFLVAILKKNKSKQVNLILIVYLI